jgi:hypothetical protein
MIHSGVQTTEGRGGQNCRNSGPVVLRLIMLLKAESSACRTVQYCRILLRLHAKMFELYSELRMRPGHGKGARRSNDNANSTTKNMRE